VANTGCEQEGVAGLVLRAQGGSEAALETLICRFQDRVAGFVYSLLGDEEAIEDICQNIFLKMISGLARLKTAESFETWLYRIARNACVDFLRRKRLRRFLIPFEEKHEQVASVLPTNEGKVEAFRVALAEMPQAQKELILLLADHDWSYEDLAKITGSTLSSVKSRLFRAREFLRQRIADEH
jgi:RNA polymerase sigma-70 factor (ECF subfamily)